MKDPPFTVYDFFGYLASGLLFLTAVAYLWFGNLERLSAVTVSFAVILLIIAYIIGHILASPAKILLETLLVDRCMGTPTENLLVKNDRWYTRIIPDYFKALPQNISQAIINSIPSSDSDNDQMKSLFTYIEGKLRYKENLTTSLDVFLTQYGFCRNISFTLLVIALLFFAAFRRSDLVYRIPYATIALLGSIVMFLRSLKFYRQYAYELLVTYGASVLTEKNEGQ